MAITKTINLNINGSQGLKTLEDLKTKSSELDAQLQTLDVTTPDFKNVKAELEAVNATLTTYTQSAQEASDIATEAFVKTSQAIVATTGTLIAFSASNDRADQITAKLAKTLAVVESIEKVAQATKATSIFLQNADNVAKVKGILSTNLLTAATAGLTAATGALRSAFLLLAAANPFTLIIAGIGLVAGALFAFSKSTADVAAEQAKLNEEFDTTNNLLQEQKKLFLDAVIAEAKRKDLRKGTTDGLKAELGLLKQFGKEEEVRNAKLREQLKLLKDSEGIFGLSEEGRKAIKEKEDAIIESNTKILQSVSDANAKQQEIDENAIDNQTEDTKKQLELNNSRLANQQDYSSQLQVLKNNLAIVEADLNARQKKGDQNTFLDRQIALQNYANSVKALNDKIIKEREEAYLRQLEIDENFDNRVKTAEGKREAEADKNAADEQQRQQEELDRENKILEAKIALGEVEKDIIKAQIDDTKTTFKERIELTNKLFELDKKRIEFNRDQALKNIDLSLEEQEVIKANADAQIKILETTKNKTIETNEAIINSFDALGVKSDEDLKKLITGLNASVDALNSFNSILDQAGVDQGSGLRALNTSLSSVLEGFAKISEDGKITFEEITTESLKAISTIAGAVNESIQASIEQNIESIDEAINAIEEKRKQVDNDINESLSKQKDLESQLSEARVGDREKILKAIDAERAREKQLAKDKVRFAEEERKLEEKKKEEKRKAFIANKAASVVQAAIATSVAIITAQAAPPPAGQILAILAGISGALQVASILAQPIPQFKSGGPTRSSRSDSDIAGIVHANEYVISAPIVRSPKFKNTINELERARVTGTFQSGGFTSPTSNDADNKLERVLQSTIELSNRPIVVTVVDINDGQQRVAQVIDQATL